MKIFGKERREPKNPYGVGFFWFFRYLPIELASQIILFADLKTTIIHDLKLEENGIEVNQRDHLHKEGRHLH